MSPSNILLLHGQALNEQRDEKPLTHILISHPTCPVLEWTKNDLQSVPVARPRGVAQVVFETPFWLERGVSWGKAKRFSQEL